MKRQVILWVLRAKVRFLQKLVDLEGRRKIKHALAQLRFFMAMVEAKHKIEAVTAGYSDWEAYRVARALAHRADDVTV